MQSKHEETEESAARSCGLKARGMILISIVPCLVLLQWVWLYCANYLYLYYLQCIRCILLHCCVALYCWLVMNVGVFSWELLFWTFILGLLLSLCFPCFFFSCFYVPLRSSFCFVGFLPLCFLLLCLLSLFCFASFSLCFPAFLPFASVLFLLFYGWLVPSNIPGTHLGLGPSNNHFQNHFRNICFRDTLLEWLPG